MKEIHEIVAINLKAYRNAHQLTLGNVSHLTGVSKTMLGQIERQESIPTITTLWKIVNGLKIPFTELIREPEEGITIRKKTELKEVQMDEGKYRVYPYFSYDQKKPVEIDMIEIEAGGYFAAKPHRPGTTEYITVYDGALELMIGEERFHLAAEESISFHADVHHTYHNPGNQLTRLNIVIHYPGK
ncbi:helix-turn-helix domain-containing protein [Macrococcus lamae]|uniref:XRE family transcriptional regulator n=1 Tax=Macrococcus lamae TaxID=198484 RepID=A0A4R6BSE4_9STAP|nr:XRE family transcriptional regulator [Macrococcus lamae]TDM06995.1 XRE family transcriptional regulator [Macrococcus lamae]